MEKISVPTSTVCRIHRSCLSLSLYIYIHEKQKQESKKTSNKLMYFRFSVNGNGVRPRVEEKKNLRKLGANIKLICAFVSRVDDE
jgi:hypothetical protein